MAETRTPKQIAADKVAGLIEKLEKAEGPSRELDAQIWLETSPGVTRSVQHVVSATGAWPPYDIDETRDETGRLITVPAYTASIDAAVALAERVLPGWRICTEFGQNYSIAQFKRGWGPARTEYLGMATTERADDEIALALCLAILKAIQEHRP